MTTAATLNLLHGKLCPPVICQPKGAAFRYLEDGAWTECNELPAHIAEALPGPEFERCENHRARRGYP